MTYDMPESVKITPRSLKLGFEGLEMNFIQDNPVLSALFCALSAVFPPGERQFIATVRYYMKDITDPVMKKRVRGFIGQESHHGNLHEDFNEKLMDLGWRVDLIENQTNKLNDWATKRTPPERQLAQTVAMEHLTALFADFLMNNPDFLGDNPHPDLKKMLIWHSIEETEHKSVAYDLYQQVCGDDEIRRQEMKMSVGFFIAHMFEATVLLLHKNKNLKSKRGWIKAYKQLLGKGGVRDYVKKEFREYYDADFHPWQNDNSELANQWLTKLAL